MKYLFTVLQCTIFQIVDSFVKILQFIVVVIMTPRCFPCWYCCRTQPL